MLYPVELRGVLVVYRETVWYGTLNTVPKVPLLIKKENPMNNILHIIIKIILHLIGFAVTVFTAFIGLFFGLQVNIILANLLLILALLTLIANIIALIPRFSKNCRHISGMFIALVGVYVASTLTGLYISYEQSVMQAYKQATGRLTLGDLKTIDQYFNDPEIERQIEIQKQEIEERRRRVERGEFGEPIPHNTPSEEQVPEEIEQ